LNFSDALNAGSAGNPGSYSVVQPGHGKHAKSKAVAVRSATYNPGNNSVTLTLGKFNAAMPLEVAATGLSSTLGTPAATITTTL
jgi:hypothetical protein